MAYSTLLLWGSFLLFSLTVFAEDEHGLLWKEARRHGWKTIGTTSDGRNFELAAIENGRPIYYITNNAVAAKNASVRLLQMPFFDPPLDGNDIIIGLWDAGWVLNTHQEFDSRIMIMDGIPDVNTVYSEHATLAAGTIGASGVDPNAKGMAPGIGIDSYDWKLDTTEMTERAAAAPGATETIYLSSHPYGAIAGWQNGIFKLITGDFNNDNIVDNNDLAVFADAWLGVPDSNNWNPICDIYPFASSKTKTSVSTA